MPIWWLGVASSSARPTGYLKEQHCQGKTVQHACCWMSAGLDHQSDHSLNALDDLLYEQVDTCFLMDFLDGHGFGCSMRYHKVYVLINLGCCILAHAYRVSAHPVSGIFTAGLVPNCEIVCIQMQCPFLESHWQFWTRLVLNGLEWLVVSTNNKFTAVKHTNENG